MLSLPVKKKEILSYLSLNMNLSGTFHKLRGNIWERGNCDTWTAASKLQESFSEILNMAWGRGAQIHSKNSYLSYGWPLNKVQRKCMSESVSVSASRLVSVYVSKPIA